MGCLSIEIQVSSRLARRDCYTPQEFIC